MKQLNFIRLIEIPNGANYTFANYVQNGCVHPTPTGYCTDCELKNIHLCPSNPNLQLRNISHGSHSNDFFAAFQVNGTPVNTAGWNTAGWNTADWNTADWNTDGVMFVMENPSNDNGIYNPVPITRNGVTYNKRPARKWYWIHQPLNLSHYGYPKFFVGGRHGYGEFFASAIVTFKLANAYLTNLVKCGMNDADGNSYKSTDEYNPKCIKNCYDNFLQHEINIMNPKVIFAFGKTVYEALQARLNNIPLVKLPHPARILENEYFSVLYFCIIAKTLRNVNVITDKFYHDLMDKFLH